MLHDLAENGYVYSWFIDPLLKSARKRVAQIVEPGTSVIDIACGTGHQSFILSAKAEKVIGVDLSASMINAAKRGLKSKKTTNTGFIQADATNLDMFEDQEFDYAILSLAVHQFDPGPREKVLQEALRISKSLIIMDYTYPLSKKSMRVATYIIERIAGKQHYRNFVDFMKKGGITGHLHGSHTVRYKEIFGMEVFEIVVLA